MVNRFPCPIQFFGLHASSCGAAAHSEAEREELVEHVFPSNRKGPLSDMAFTVLMRRHQTAAVPHGFRSTFRDWAGETTNHPRDAVELCLAHTIDTKTEAAYRRAGMLEKRLVIMQDWANFATSEAVAPSKND